MAFNWIEAMKNIIRSKIGLVIACLSLLLFFIALLLPVEYIPLDTTQDKYHHGFFFFGLTVLLYLCTHLRIWTLSILVVILASLSELSQKLAPQRSSNWQDLKADFYGIGAAVLTILLIMLIRRVLLLRKNQKESENQQ